MLWQEEELEVVPPPPVEEKKKLAQTPEDLDASEAEEIIQ